MKRSKTCDGCKCVVPTDRDPGRCRWPCSRFGLADLLRPRGIAARLRWLVRRGVYQVRPYVPGDAEPTMTAPAPWYDGGELWADAHQFILRERRMRLISRATAAREWRLLNDCLGAERGTLELRRWFAETYSSEMNDHAIRTVRLQFKRRRP